MGILVVDPSFALEFSASGTVRAKGVSGAGNGLDQTRWEFEGAKWGDLECSFPAACVGTKLAFTGPIKVQGAEAAQLETYK